MNWMAAQMSMTKLPAALLFSNSLALVRQLRDVFGEEEEGKGARAEENDPLDTGKGRKGEDGGGDEGEEGVAEEGDELVRPPGRSVPPRSGT